MVAVGYVFDAVMVTYAVFLFAKRSSLAIPSSLFAAGLIFNDLAKLVHPPQREWLVAISVVLFILLLVLYGPDFIAAIRAAGKEHTKK